MRVAAITIFASLALGTSTAAADTLSLAVSPSTGSVNANSVELTVSGSASPGEWLDIRQPQIKREGQGCPAVPAEGSFVEVHEGIPPFPMVYRAGVPHLELGSYMICGYLTTGVWEGVSAVAETTLNVRTDAEIEAASNAEARARESAEWTTAEERARNAPVSHLTVTTISRPGKSSQHPGETELILNASPFAQVTLKLTGRARRSEHFEMDPAMPSETSAETIIPVEWTCARPGGVYKYVVTAHSEVGATLTRRGQFRPVSVARCNLLKRHEAEAKERDARRYAEEEARVEYGHNLSLDEAEGKTISEEAERG
ncbi:MAG TPA: hypothetical protein VKG38_18100 [Solirubrobacteraceae bacterium]|nr:hypothetical protein [Solirubrobacteraceae bacterium]